MSLFHGYSRHFSRSKERPGDGHVLAPDWAASVRFPDLDIAS